MLFVLELYALLSSSIIFVMVSSHTFSLNTVCHSIYPSFSLATPESCLLFIHDLERIQFCYLVWYQSSMFVNLYCNSLEFASWLVDSNFQESHEVLYKNWVGDLAKQEDENQHTKEAVSSSHLSGRNLQSSSRAGEGQSSQSMEDKGVKLDLFTDTNFPSWQLSLRLFLMQKSLWGIVSGS